MIKNNKSIKYKENVIYRLLWFWINHSFLDRNIIKNFIQLWNQMTEKMFILQKRVIIP